MTITNLIFHLTRKIWPVNSLFSNEKKTDLFSAKLFHLRCPKHFPRSFNSNKYEPIINRCFMAKIILINDRKKKGYFNFLFDLIILNGCNLGTVSFSIDSDGVIKFSSIFILKLRHRFRLRILNIVKRLLYIYIYS